MIYHDNHFTSDWHEKLSEKKVSVARIGFSFVRARAKLFLGLKVLSAFQLHSVMSCCELPCNLTCHPFCFIIFKVFVFDVSCSDVKRKQTNIRNPSSAESIFNDKAFWL